jgi:hypothetical protein
MSFLGGHPQIDFFCRLWTDERGDSSVSELRDEYPQKPVFPLGSYVPVVIAIGNVHIAFEMAMVDLHRDDPYRLGSGWVFRFVLEQRFRSLAISAYVEFARGYFHFDMIIVEPGQLDADAEAGSALKHVHLRPPLRAGLLELGEVYLGKLIGHFTDLALDETEA